MKPATLTFTQDQLVLLNTAIQELPMKHAAPLINEINRQIAEQQAEPEPAQPAINGSAEAAQ